MANKIVLITGSNKGIGYGTAKLILETAPEFSTVILTARNPELGLRSQSTLGHPDRTVFHQLDVTDKSSISALAAFVQSNYGQIDVLINNAGWAAKGDDFNYEIVSTTIGVNFYGIKDMVEAFVPLIKPGGHIVNVSSSAGVTAALRNPDLAQRFLDPELTLEGVIELSEEFKTYVKDGVWVEKGWPTFGYGVSKNLVNAYTRVLHKEFQRTGVQVRVNALHPGWVRTDMAGEEAELSIEEGSVVPVKVARDTSEISGKFWIEDRVVDFY